MSGFLELMFRNFGSRRKIKTSKLRIAITRCGCVFTTTMASLNIPEGVLFTDFVKRLKNDRCFHELNYISLT